jgi:RNA polymerase sigma factor (TIGR02999 family)
LLDAWRNGDARAPGEIFSLLYDDLVRVARAQLRRRSTSHLATTDLVHEAYLKLADHPRVDVRDRAHFLAVASRVMQQILTDRARRTVALKRGGPIAHVTLTDVPTAAGSAMAELIALNQALSGLEEIDPRLAGIVEARFFTGLSVKETADALGLSERTVKRDWQKARAYLHDELHPQPGA